MVETFEHPNLVISLIYSPIRAASPYHLVEVQVRDKLGEWRTTELPLKEFHTLLFQKVFPAVAKRISILKAEGRF